MPLTNWINEQANIRDDERDGFHLNNVCIIISKSISAIMGNIKLLVKCIKLLMTLKLQTIRRTVV